MCCRQRNPQRLAEHLARFGLAVGGYRDGYMKRARGSAALYGPQAGLRVAAEGLARSMEPLAPGRAGVCDGPALARAGLYGVRHYEEMAGQSVAPCEGQNDGRRGFRKRGAGRGRKGLASFMRSLPFSLRYRVPSGALVVSSAASIRGSAARSIPYCESLCRR